MTDLLEKCGTCHAMLDEEDLFCANCGREAPHRDRSEQQQTTTSKHNFGCDGCGASMSCADVMSCKRPRLKNVACGTSYVIGTGIPGDDWDSCGLD